MSYYQYIPLTILLLVRKKNILYSVCLISAFQAKSGISFFKIIKLPITEYVNTEINNTNHQTVQTPCTEKNY